MKYIIIGMGNFGASLSQKLTEMGHEVIGVDNSMSKVESIKDRITHAVCMDCTDFHAVSSLPLDETDIVIVGIGEDAGANIMVTALMKQLKVKRLVSRAVSPLQETVIQAIGVDEIIHPEEETAERWAKKLNMSGVVDSFEINDDYSIIEVKVPQRYANKTIQQVGFRPKYNIVVLTTIKTVEEKNLLGLPRKVNKVQGVASPDTRLNPDDILVIYGKNTDIQNLLTE
jgi:trk system potassium uptake protein TrkA